MKRASKLIEKYGIPGRDLYELPASTMRFPDGAHYRIEISGVERPEVCEAILDEADKRGVPVHRLISTVMGATLLSRDELKRFAQLAHDARVEVIITPGPRATWDVGRQIATPEGVACGLRFRSADSVAQYIEDILRCIDVGFRGFLVWDEGVLWLLNQMRDNGDIPAILCLRYRYMRGMLTHVGRNCWKIWALIRLTRLVIYRYRHMHR